MLQRTTLTRGDDTIKKQGWGWSDVQYSKHRVTNCYKASKAELTKHILRRPARL